MYELRKRLNGEFCVYCGMRAATVDHYPPKSLTNWGLLLPCCSECNSFAGTIHPFDFEKRANFVKKKIKTKNKKYLDMPVWSIDDLSELSGNLKRSVKVCQEKRRITNKRLAWDVYNYLLSLAKDKHFAKTFAECGIIITSEKLLTNNSV